MGWAARQQSLLTVTDKQLFFVGGAPRSGTTWLQKLLDAHPDVSCRGEGLFPQHLATPLDELLKRRRDAVARKNERVFKHTDGYPVPGDDHADQMIGTGIMLALQQQCATRTVKAVGEKTPENVFFFPRLLRLFPEAKFIVISRDPRDVLASAWHFFRNEPGAGDVEKVAFLRQAFPSLAEGARAAQSFCAAQPHSSLSLTYEGLLAATAAWAARLFAFLGVASDKETVSACVERTSFAALSRGREPGAPANGSFFRTGVVGSWRDTFDESMNEMILGELGWMFELYGWGRQEGVAS